MKEVRFYNQFEKSISIVYNDTKYTFGYMGKLTQHKKTEFISRLSHHLGNHKLKDELTFGV